MKIKMNRPLSPGEKQDLTLFFKSLKGDISHMTFDSFFYDSEETRQTVEILTSLTQPNDAIPKVLFLWGKNSSGKSHLLHAIKHKGIQSIHYITSDQLSQELMQAIREDNVSKLVNSFCKVDILLIDDAQFLVAKEAMIDFLYKEIVPRVRQNIILASDCDPQNIGIIRGNSNILILKPPGLEARKKILRQKMDELQLAIDDDLQHHIASTLTDPRKINGFLAYLKAMQTSNQ